MSWRMLLEFQSMKIKRRVLGIDPGLARLGWAIIDIERSQPTLVGCGCLETSATEKIAARLLVLHQRLNSIILEYAPTQMAIETLLFTKNISTGMAVSQARGAVLLSAAENKLSIEEFSPTAVKSSITGDGRADKRQMGKMIQLLLGLQRLPKHDDTTDAIGVALCGATMNMLH